MNIYLELARSIIKAQENVVGPLALEQAKRVSGVKVGNTSQDVVLEGDEKDAVNRLVKQYEGLFGKVSLEVCKRAALPITSSTEKNLIPPLLA